MKRLVGFFVVFLAMTLGGCVGTTLEVTSGVTSKVISIDNNGDYTISGTATGDIKFVSLELANMVIETEPVEDNQFRLKGRLPISDNQLILVGTSSEQSLGVTPSDKAILKSINLTTKDSLSTDSDSSSSDALDDPDDPDSTWTDNDDSTDDTSDFDAADYSTKITYDQLARTPADYKWEKVAFTGQVVQLLEGDSNFNLRVAIDGDYDQMVLVVYDPDIMDGSRVLEDDKITFYGESVGTTTYQSTMGGKITIPQIDVDKIDDAGKAPADYGD